MQKSHLNKSLKYIKDQIRQRESELAALRADLQLLEVEPPDVPTWRGMVASAWSSEGEPDWEGTIKAPTLREAVYATMLAFCKKAGRVYPGYKSTETKVWDHFDVQGTVYISMRLPNGTAVPVDRASLDKLKAEFNKKAPMPKRKPRKEPVGLT